MNKHQILLLKGVILLIGIFYINWVSAQSFIPLNSVTQKEAINVEVLQSDQYGYVAKYTINGIYENTISRNGSTFHQLFFEEGFALNKVGEPELPIIAQNILIPPGADYSASLEELSWKSIVIGKVIPAQNDHLMSEKQIPFDIDNDIYNMPEYIPQLLTEDNSAKWYQVNSVSLAVCPFKYYPTSGRLDVLNEFVLSVKFVNGSSTSLNSTSIKGKDLLGLFANEELAKELSTKQTKFNTRSNDDYDYLIIIGDIPEIENSQELQDFIRWKSCMGYKVKVVSTSSIGSSDTLIKNYIIQEKAKGIEYVLLIGGKSNIPVHEKTIHDLPEDSISCGDYWYGCLDGESDYVADVAVGRFSTNSLSEFRNIVNKTIRYEGMDNTYCNKVLLVAHKQSDSTYSFQQDCQNVIDRQPYYYVPVSFYTAFGGNNATNSDVITNLNSGRHIVVYNGHGENGMWFNWNNSNQSFTVYNLSSLNNDVNSIFWAYACATADIREPINLLEYSMNPSYGAVSYFGAMVNVYNQANREMLRAIFIGLYRTGIYTLGKLINYSKHYYLATYYYSKREYNAFSYICGGDPSLEIWTESPSLLDDISIEQSGNNITIGSTAVSDYVVSVVSENGQLLANYNSSGTSCTFTKPSGKFYVSVHKHNYIPRVVYLDTESAYLQNKTIDGNAFYTHNPFSIGYNVTNTETYGSVLIKQGANVRIKGGSNDILIKNNFECEEGAVLSVGE